MTPSNSGPTPSFLWDLDGTLLDTYPAIDGALQDALAALGRPTELTALVPLTRVTLGHAIGTLAARLGLEEDALWQAHGQAEARRSGQFAPPMPYACEVMTEVRARGALNLVVTHRDREGAIVRLQAAGLWPLVDDLISVSDGYARKPDPAMFLAAMDRHALKPAGCLAVGDRELDIRAAHDAGIPAALLVTPGANLAVEAEYMLPDLKALLGVLNTDLPA
ncbi:HAD family hydrolase [Deinococcus marmoris]|uniref:Hydrolase, haloacid dehalogenase-like family n=1 Tax=Deinococcus marmoris TaxID=249408 RepID=A0A1U7P4L4_9DEIO|nr:HAD-IA family hydrolase [Deinococcus marmoris]OLV20100.1 hydrolase, haloacid dehalogenase-like family [Deinococcus marmoris]